MKNCVNIDEDLLVIPNTSRALSASVGLLAVFCPVLSLQGENKNRSFPRHRVQVMCVSAHVRLLVWRLFASCYL